MHVVEREDGRLSVQTSLALMMWKAFKSCNEMASHWVCSKAWLKGHGVLRLNNLVLLLASQAPDLTPKTQCSLVV